MLQQVNGKRNRGGVRAALETIVLIRSLNKPHYFPLLYYSIPLNTMLFSEKNSNIAKKISHNERIFRWSEFRILVNFLFNSVWIRTIDTFWVGKKTKKVFDIEYLYSNASFISGSYTNKKERRYAIISPKEGKHVAACKKLFSHIEEPSPGASRHPLPEEGWLVAAFGRIIKIVASFAWHSQSPRVTAFLRLLFVCTSDTWTAHCSLLTANC